MSKISMDKKYTLNGAPVRILCVDANNEYPVAGLVKYPDGSECLEEFDSDGKIAAGNDYLVEVSPYADWKIDDKIEVSADGEEWVKRHFAGIDNDGNCLCYNNGLTSWSKHIWENGEPCVSHWAYARKPIEPTEESI